MKLLTRIMNLFTGKTTDKKIQDFTNRGSYTVKSGYWLGANHLSRNIHSCGRLEIASNELKARIWKICTLPNIRMFLWRCLSGALVVADRLNSKGLNVNNTCRICQSGDETINHVLFHCSYAHEVWRRVAITGLHVSFSPSLEENFRTLLNTMELQGPKLTRERKSLGCCG